MDKLIINLKDIANVRPNPSVGADIPLYSDLKPSKRIIFLKTSLEDLYWPTDEH